MNEHELLQTEFEKWSVTPENIPFAELARLTRRVNALNGWRPDYTPEQALSEIPELLVLIHTEISEAFYEYTPLARCGELADVMIRAFDTCELLRPGGLPAFPEDPVQVTTAWPNNLLALHAHTSAAMEAYRKADETEVVEQIMLHLRDLYANTHDLIAEYGQSSRSMILGKLLKNLERGYRHGGRRA